MNGKKSSKNEQVSHQLQQIEFSHWQAFTYFTNAAPGNPSSQAEQSTSEHSKGLPRSSKPLSLAEGKVGDRLCITALNCGEANHRLVGMGLIPGAVVEVLSCTPTGSVIVALQDQRLGLGAEMARLIQVINTQEPLGVGANRTTARIVAMSTSSEASTAQSAGKSTTISTVKLRDVAIGATVRVLGYEPTARDYKRKLLAMGLTPGTSIRVTRHAPMGDPTEIEVRGFQLSLRKTEADALIVEPITEG